ncbi:MAG: orotidine-5'-phosphate decarboxylase [Candidatus Kerfeldbacteria bacterium]
MGIISKLGEVKNPVAKKLVQVIHSKRSNLCLSLDVTRSKEFLALADALGPQICVLKTHIDTMEDFSDDVVSDLLKLAHEHNFLIFEDRKFADIGNTVKLQYEKGIYHISDWADITNAHIIPGEGVIEGLKEVGLPKGRGLLLLAEMSSKGSLATGKYTKTAYKWAAAHDEFVIGFVGKGSADVPKGMLVFTPGVNLEATGDALGQQYQTPREAMQSGTDVIIVGRGIYKADDPVKAAEQYRHAAWEEYSEEE